MSDTNETPEININLDRGGPDNHIWQVLGTILACGGVGMVAWAVANTGYRELAATGITIFLFQLVAMMSKVGLLKLPKSDGESAFKETSGNLRTAWREFQAWQARSPVWRLAAMAMAYTIVFLTARAAMDLALGVFDNVWFAGGAAAFLASLIVAPNLYANMGKKMKTAGVIPEKKDRSEQEAEGL